MKISEIFYSIQGEGIFAGKPTVFVRLFGCNLRCHFCDTKYAFEGEYEEKTPAELSKHIQEMNINTNHICVTGGEPLMQQEEVYDFVKNHIHPDSIVTIETNGSIVPVVCWNDIYSNVNFCISPKDLTKPAIPYPGFVVYKFVYDDNIDEINRYIAMNNIMIHRVLLMPLTTGVTWKDYSRAKDCIRDCLNYGYGFSPRLQVTYNLK